MWKSNRSKPNSQNRFNKITSLNTRSSSQPRPSNIPYSLDSRIQDSREQSPHRVKRQREKAKTRNQIEAKNQYYLKSRKNSGFAGDSWIFWACSKTKKKVYVQDIGPKLRKKKRSESIEGKLNDSLLKSFDNLQTSHQSKPSPYTIKGGKHGRSMLNSTMLTKEQSHSLGASWQQLMDRFRGVLRGYEQRLVLIEQDRQKYRRRWLKERRQKGKAKC